jgi:hypothetical protein
VFPARYELNSYIVFRKRLVSKRLSNNIRMFWLAKYLEVSHDGTRTNAWLTTVACPLTIPASLFVL